MFHVELKQSVHLGRKFNLTREELDARFARPWVNGESIMLEDLVYEPLKAKLTIVEAPELHVGEMGMGRGWQNVDRAGEDVTDRVLNEIKGGGVQTSAADALVSFKRAVQGACALESRPLGDIVRLAGLRHPGSRASERLALAERALWELLHQGGLALFDADENPVEQEGWEFLVLAWDSWTGPVEQQPRVGTLATHAQ